MAPLKTGAVKQKMLPTAPVFVVCGLKKSAKRLLLFIQKGGHDEAQ
jgi:hypothetical protein